MSGSKFRKLNIREESFVFSKVAKKAEKRFPSNIKRKARILGQTPRELRKVRIKKGQKVTPNNDLSKKLALKIARKFKL